MSQPQNDDLRRAREVLTIFKVWDVAVREGAIATREPTPTRDALYWSPFRDRGDRPTFSISHGGRAYKDFAREGVAGDVWGFAELCWPSMKPGDLAKKYIEMSGIVPTPRPAPPASAPGAAAPVDPRLARAAKTMAKRDRERELQEQVYQERERALEPKTKVEDIPAWPGFVADRFNDGNAFLAAETSKMADLAKARGWPLQWVEELVNCGMLSYALERWADPGAKYAKRQKAFKVDLPQLRLVAGASGNTMTADLRPVGYHQRFFVPASESRPEQKGWVYVPSVPKPGPRYSTFEHGLIEYGQERGLGQEERRSLVPPLPFVLGDLAGPRLVILLEGQWDAITFYGACGWFEDANPPKGVAVFGLRGNQGVDVFLAYWGRWLQINKPVVWIIADNDAAGRSWLEAPEPDPGMPRMPSFAEKLKHAHCREVFTSFLKPGPWGKDFNDYYRAAPVKPSIAKMHKWMRDVGVLQANGQWA